MKFKVKKNRILSVDVEMTCEEDGKEWEYKPEIIQIGIVEIDVTRSMITRKRSWLTIPETSPITEYCSNLTGITPQRMKKNGVRYSEAMAQADKMFGIGSKAWMAWGSDKQQIDEDCKHKNARLFSNAFFDMGLMYSLLYGSGKAISLKKAAADLGISYEAAHHDAENDAELAAMIWLNMAKRLNLNFGCEETLDMETSLHHHL